MGMEGSWRKKFKKKGGGGEEKPLWRRNIKIMKFR